LAAPSIQPSAAAGRVGSFGGVGKLEIRPVLAPSLNYLAQVLSAFKAVSADAFVA
jgi:hypothetical protein